MHFNPCYLPPTRSQSVRGRGTFAGLRLALVAVAAVAASPVTLLAQGQPWSSQDTWGGLVPRAGADVTIPPGKTVVLDTDATVGELRIQGTLRAARRDLRLSAARIIVSGTLEIGTSDAPFSNKAIVTLTGPRPSNPQAHDKGIVVMNGGQLKLHGASRSKQSWTQLAATVPVGATSLQTAFETGWQPGDRIVLATTSTDPRANDVVTIQAVSGRAVSFAPAVRHPHFGERAVYGGRTLDMRGEVGLLTHNIVIEGDESSETSKFGGHVMLMQDSELRPQGGFSRPPQRGTRAFVEGVEFYRMGQRRLPGRYPFHWHLIGDGSGQVMRQCSVHHSFHRAVAVHGTDNVRVESVVAFDIDSHAFVVSEEGDEVNNAFVRNLGILTRTLLPEDFAFPWTKKPGRTTQSEQTAGIFWMRNPANTIRGNHAVGGDIANGFFFDTGVVSDRNNDAILSAARAARGSSVITDFAHNVAHSIFNPATANADIYRPLAHGWGVFCDNAENATFDINNFTAYKCQQGGVWLESGGLLRDSIVSDCHMAVSLLGVGEVRDSVLLGQSINNLGPILPTSRGGIHLQFRTDSSIDLTARSVQFINLPVGILVEQNARMLQSGLTFRDCNDAILMTPASGGSQSPTAPFAHTKNGTFVFHWKTRVAPSEGTPDPAQPPTPTPTPTPAPTPAPSGGLRFEAEQLTIRSSAQFHRYLDARASGGRWLRMKFDPQRTGDYIEVEASVPAGRYALWVTDILHGNHAVVQAQVDGVSLGAPFDQRSDQTRFVERNLGIVTFAQGGPHRLRFTVTAVSHDQSRGRVGFDVIRFVPAD